MVEGATARPGLRRWAGVIDTNYPLRTDLAIFDFGHSYTVAGRSFLAFVLATEPKQPQRLRHGMGPYGMLPKPR